MLTRFQIVFLHIIFAYYSYHNLSLLYIKKIRIYIEPVNPKLDYIINIICSIIAKLYLEVQLCTTSKVVNHINHIIMKNDTKCIIFTIHMESFLIIYCYVSRK